ncbi:MAG: glycosyltransferase family protein, partial [Sarcina sp.]
AFAGSWYERHEERKKVTREILDIFSKYDLTIYDRHYNKDTNGRNTFPDKYKNYIKGGLPYSEMIKTYKKYDVFLNVNTVLNSPTMYSRRVFELLGCGTNVVTTESLGIAKDFENIVLRTNEDNFNLKIKSILNDKDLKDKNSLKGIREIVTKHTYQKRFDFIVKKLKIKNYRKENFNVSVIACTNRPEYIENIIKNYTTQKYANKELIIILNNNNINLLKVKERIENLSNIYIYKLDEKLTLGECINFGVEKSNSAYIAKFDDDDFYGENYLIDMIMPFRYSEADVVGKKSIYIYYEGSNTLELKYANTEYRYSDFISGATLVFKKTVFEKVQLESRNLGEDTAFINNCKLLGMKLYSADRFNYIAYRRIDKNSHTWKVSDEALKSKSEVIKNNISYEDSKEIVLV